MHTPNHRPLLLACALLLAGASASALASPGNGNGKGNNGHGNGNGNGHGGHGNAATQSAGPSIDIGGIRIVLQDNRDYWSPGASLPPGIRKNLARGKPLPPGIARKLDGRLLQRLPSYPGYDWVQAGTDLLLVAVATGLIQEVLHDVLD